MRSVLKNVSGGVSYGKILQVTGKNGSGKSTLLKALSGLIRLDSGQIDFENKPLHDFSCTITYLGHQLGLKSELTPFENIKWLSALSNNEFCPQYIERLFTLFDLSLKKHTPLKLLSAGQQKKAALIGTLMNPKPIMILDEPFANLDEGSIASVCHELEQLSSSGHAVILATHQPFVGTGRVMIHELNLECSHV